jgi:hypothetical protein
MINLANGNGHEDVGEALTGEVHVVPELCRC